MLLQANEHQRGHMVPSGSFQHNHQLQLFRLQLHFCNLVRHQFRQCFSPTTSQPNHIQMYIFEITSLGNSAINNMYYLHKVLNKSLTSFTLNNIFNASLVMNYLEFNYLAIQIIYDLNFMEYYALGVHYLVYL